MKLTIKLEFHDTDIFARIVARMSVCRPFSLQQLAVSRGSAARLTRTTILADLSADLTHRHDFPHDDPREDVR